MNADEWRERQKQLRKEHQARRRAELATDPRVQAMKHALAERRRAAYEVAKARKREIAERRRAMQAEARERKQQLTTERRDAELRALVHPATVAGEEQKR
jgi:hypothetical protein